MALGTCQELYTFIKMKCINDLAFYNYPITTNIKQYGSNRMAKPYDPPTQNTIVIIALLVMNDTKKRNI